jgi:hypothetical protein
MAVNIKITTIGDQKLLLAKRQGPTYCHNKENKFNCQISHSSIAYQIDSPLHTFRWSETWQLLAPEPYPGQVMSHFLNGRRAYVLITNSDSYTVPSNRPQMSTAKSATHGNSEMVQFSSNPLWLISPCPFLLDHPSDFPPRCLPFK